MRAVDLMEDGFPHGTADGYKKGCHSKGACMGPLEGLPTCVDAMARYGSDYGYRKRVDGGMSAQAIASEDAAAAPASKSAAAVAVERPAEKFPDVELQQVVPKPAPPLSPSSVPQSDDLPKPYFMTDAEIQQMVDLHKEGLSDADIAAALGRSQPNVSKKLRERGLEPNGKTFIPKAAKAKPAEPPAAVHERAQEVRADGFLDELADARADIARLKHELDTAEANVAIEKTARETLAGQVAELTQMRIDADEKRVAAEQRVSELTDQVAGLSLELDVAKSPDAAPSGAELATVPSAPVAAAVEELPVLRAGSVGLDIQQLGDALSVRLHGGEPVHLNLQFTGGSLSDVGVKIGA